MLLALVPALYASYSAAVREFTVSGLLTAIAYVALPALLFRQAQGRSIPTLTDLVAALYLLLSLAIGLVPTLTLPRLDGQVSLFAFITAPLLLVLLAMRGWRGLGFTWFLTKRDLGTALLVAAVLGVGIAPLALVLGVAPPPFADTNALNLLVQMVLLYFLIALPAELLFRGFIQRGITRYAEYVLRQEQQRTSESRLRRNAPALLGIGLTALVFGLSQLPGSANPPATLVLATLTGVGYGLVYLRTEKVTASAVAHALVLWVVQMLGAL
ncbi:MAG: CPBP family intramembrane metalloprotease [Chloroflexaceae bacterium]|nr:CPBP family intramembrane metalloprotease [Chloroflexaceae bacterium]